MVGTPIERKAEEAGATLLEYSVLAAGICLAVLFAVGILGTAQSEVFTTTATAMGGGTVGTTAVASTADGSNGDTADGVAAAAAPIARETESSSNKVEPAPTPK